MLIHSRTLFSLTAAWLLINTNTSYAATTTTSSSILENEQLPPPAHSGNQHIVRVIHDHYIQQQQQQQQQQREPSAISATTSIDAFAMTNALSEYYENIVDQVMATLTEEITLSAPRSYMSIHHYGTVRRGRCRTSLRSFVHDLRDHLNLMRANLLASIRPLVESNLPSVLPYTQQQQQQQQQDIAVIGARLTEDILSLNRHIVLQLGLILNVEEAADIIISQSMPTRVLLLEDATHLRDSSHNPPTASATLSWSNQHQQLVLLAKKPSASSRNTNNNNNNININSNSNSNSNSNNNNHNHNHNNAYDYDYEDEIEDEGEALAWLETLRRESEEEQQRPESRALTHWLRSWLSEVEEILRVQFDERVQDATQSILEDFLIDDSY